MSDKKVPPIFEFFPESNYITLLNKKVRYGSTWNYRTYRHMYYLLCRRRIVRMDF